MSGVLHPVGPEPEQTYWLRRALVLGTALLLLLGLVLGLSHLGSGSAASAAPPPVVAATPAATSPSPSATRVATPLPSSSASSAASGTPAPTAGSSTTGKAGKNAKPKPAAPARCAPAELRATLTGPKRLKPKQHAAFELSLINGSGAACVVTVDRNDFALTVYSGRDRIWTSAHCARAVKPITRKVAAEDAVEWSMTWNGRRSAKGCRSRSETPRPGTYVATAHLDGAKPVTFRTILRG